MLGEKLIIACYRLFSSLKMYENNNQMLRDTARELMDILVQGITQENELAIQISKGQFFINNSKITFHQKNVHLISEMIAYFDQRMISAIHFKRAFSDAALEQVLGFSRLIDQAVKEKNPVQWLHEKFSKEAFPWVEISAGSEPPDPENEDQIRDIAQKTYSYALTSLKEVSRKIVTQDRAGVHKLKRTVQKMVDFLIQDDSILMGMSTFREHDDYTYTHSVNVAVLSMCLGRRIGLSKLSLSWLGICGMVHDLGKVDIPKEILNKPGKLSPNEILQMQKHPVNSVSRILRLQTTRDLKTKILLPPLEHHMKYDFSGYPRVRRNQPISLFGRIIAIADVFDALSSARVYRPKAFSPDQVLNIMLEGSGKDFDPILLKVFMNMLGRYPVGTVVFLDTGEQGIAAGVSETSDHRTRPQVVLLIPDGQGGYKKGKKVDLAQKNPNSGAFVRNIVQSEHPAVYGIQPTAFIF